MRCLPKSQNDHIVKYTREFTMAVVEMEPTKKLPSGGLHQAKEYAEIFDLKYAYSTHGHGIIYSDRQTKFWRERPNPSNCVKRIGVEVS